MAQFVQTRDCEDRSKKLMVSGLRFTELDGVGRGEAFFQIMGCV